MKNILLRSTVRIALVIALLLAMTHSANAESISVPSLELSTQYPAMVVKAGDSLTFDLDIDNNTGKSQDISLSIQSIPENWTGSFSASSKQVSIVHVKNEEANTSVDFALDIPLDAPDGEYIVALKAQGEGYHDVMEIKLTLSAEEVGDSSFTVEYPSQEGDADTSFSYDATLINNMLSDQSYSFAASAPTGWQVSFKPSGESTKVAALDVEARSTQGVDITIEPPAGIEAGTYDIAVTATSANEKMTLELSITITGSYELSLSTPSGRLSFDAYANKESAVQLSLTNEGNTELTNVNLTSSAPSGWNVRFANETIELIEAGATIETTAYITPGEDAMSGDYVTTLSAKNSNASDSAEFRVTVKTETKWGFAGVAIIAAMAAVLYSVMKKYGRR